MKRATMASAALVVGLMLVLWLGGCAVRQSTQQAAAQGDAAAPAGVRYRHSVHMYGQSRAEDQVGTRPLRRADDWEQQPNGFGQPGSDEPPLLRWGSEQELVEDFSEAIVSWNVSGVEPHVCVLIEMRVAWGALGREQWSPYLRLGRIGTPRPGDEPVREFTAGERVSGKIDVDYFVAGAGCRFNQYQVRVLVQGCEVAEAPTIERLAVVLTGEVDRGGGGLETVIDRSVERPRFDTCVPFRSQRTDEADLAGRLCSPTSVAMVLAYYGVNVDVGVVAERSFDPDSGLFGNWPRNVQAAFSLGVPGVVTRFADWNDVERLLRAGRPIVASIRVREGELRGAPYAATAGHLIVLRGVDERGDILVNDPAASTPEAGMVTYSREDLTNVWMRGSKGTAYLLEPR